MLQHNSILRQLVVCVLLFGQVSCAMTTIVRKQPETLEDLLVGDIIIVTTKDGNTRRVEIRWVYPEYMEVSRGGETEVKIRYEEIVKFKYVGTKKLNEGKAEWVDEGGLGWTFAFLASAGIVVLSIIYVAWLVDNQ